MSRRIFFLLTEDTNSGHRVAVALEAIPEESTIPYLSYTVTQVSNLLIKFTYPFQIPLSLKIIEVRSLYPYALSDFDQGLQDHARSKSYATAKDFGLEMARLFEKSRLWHKPSTEAYGRVLLLQVKFTPSFQTQAVP
jgi:chromatin structure-remodeling complex subunit RSC1/2